MPSTRSLLLAAVVLGLLNVAATPAPADPLQPLLAALRDGREEQATVLFQPLQSSGPAAQRTRAAVLLSQSLLRLGQAAEARKVLEPLMQATPLTSAEMMDARVVLGRTYQQLGEQDRERALWNSILDDHDAERLDLKQPGVLRGLAIACRYLGSYQDANDTFKDGVAQARSAHDSAELLRLNVEWAELFLEKYAAGYAEQSLDEALAQGLPLPEDVDARALLAQVKSEQGDSPGANRELDRALLQNPRHAGALRTRAQLLLEDEDDAGATRLLSAVVARNPEDVQTRSLLAGASFLRDRGTEHPAFKAQQAEVLRRQPHYSAFFRTVAELLTTQHRYDEAAALLEEAVRREPRDYAALSLLGSSYLRQGQDDKGLEMLRRAFRGDRFNVRTFNLLNLFEKVIPKSYTTVTVDMHKDRVGQGGLRLRLPEAEKALLLPLLVPFVQAEWRELTARYGAEPPLPLTLELYEDAKHYAVRTVGLPGLAALGVTFGRVVTGRSPAHGDFNWGVMIWHELSHVFAIHLSRSRVPRWFTEGLSEWETEHHDPDWTRRTHAELYGALSAGQLLPLERLDSGFTQARSVSGIVVAYHEAAEVMGFLVRRFGFPKIVAALRQFAKGGRVEEVLPLVTGQSLSALNDAFRRDLAAHLTAYQGTFVLRPSEYADMEELERRVKERPGEARAHGLLALALLKAGDTQKASLEAQAAQRIDGACPEALMVEAEVRFRAKDLARAEASLRALLAQRDGYDARERLAEILVARAGKEPQAIPGEAEFQAAKRLDPDRAEPYEELAKLYERAGRKEDAVKELRAAAHLDVMDSALWRSLVKRLYEQQRWAQVVEYGAGARFLAPYDGELRTQIGEALLKLGRRTEALAELDAALATLPEPSDEEDAASLRTRREALQRLRAQAGGKP